MRTATNYPMKVNPLPPLQYLEECFHFTKQGTLTWKQRPRHHFATERAMNWRNSRNAGRVAGYSHGKYGYQQLCLDSTQYFIQRILFYLYHGWEPDKIDHKDTETSNNSIANLRPATNSQNSAHTKTPQNNTCGFKGVSWSQHSNKWQVQIQVNRKYLHVGHFDDINEAAKAYNTAAKQYFGEYALLGYEIEQT